MLYNGLGSQGGFAQLHMYLNTDYQLVSIDFAVMKSRFWITVD